jgi:hypothetical protein
MKAAVFTFDLIIAIALAILLFIILLYSTSPIEDRSYTLYKMYILAKDIAFQIRDNPNTLCSLFNSIEYDYEIIWSNNNCTKKSKQNYDLKVSLKLPYIYTNISDIDKGPYYYYKTCSRTNNGNSIYRCNVNSYNLNDVLNNSFFSTDIEVNLFK